jgi:hypothetical protein
MVATVDIMTGKSHHELPAQADHEGPLEALRER